METTWRITEADRDEAGKIRVEAPAEPRSLDDLLPKSGEIKQDAQRQRLTRSEAAGLTVVCLAAMFIIVYAYTTPTAAPVSLPTPAATAVATMQPTIAPTVAPTQP